ncbi:MAG: protoporphyrinogen oxidase [Litorilinea sp.]
MHGNNHESNIEPPAGSADSGFAKQDDGQTVDLAIVGGGVSGLATAYYARKYWAEADGSGNPRSLRLALFEASDRFGGKVQTEVVDTGGATPFIVEAGPDSFLTQKPWALQLAQELGLGDALMGTNDYRRKVYVLQGGRLLPMPDGLQLIVPTRLLPFLRSPLISPLGKLRMALDLMLPRKQDDRDETLADFVTRRLGREALDKLAEPLMSGIYSAEADRQSILATFPRFRELERIHGSLIRGILAGAAARKQAASPSPQNQTGSSQTAPRSVFITPVLGTHELIRRLVSELGEQAQAGVAVQKIAARQDAAGYTLTLANGTQVHANAVVVAVPAPTAARLLGELAPDSAARLASIRHVSTVTLTLAYAPDAVPHAMDGFGVVIPQSEQRDINAITWTTRKFDQRAPDGHHLIRVFLGGSRNPEILAHDDETLLAIAQRELAAIMGVTAPPLFHRLFRWQDASPQYDVGHLEMVDAIEAGLPPQLFVTGSPYRGIGIPDCVHQAQNTARQFVDTYSDTPIKARASALTEPSAIH